MTLNSYKLLTRLIAPIVPLWLSYRKCKGKEDAGRMQERYGKSSYARPKGQLLWIHGASVGEANSVLALIHSLKARFPNLNILLTTGTVTSAQLMKQRLPKGVLHQYVPIDTPEATQAFIRHWLPDVVWFVESEIWPNLIDAAREYFCIMALINGRMSARSFAFWQKHSAFSADIFSAFKIAFAQSEEDAKRLKLLGVKEVLSIGNIKYDAPALPCNEGELLKLKEATDQRIGWLAASTHPGEESLIAEAHIRLAKQHRGLLTIIVPRHPERGADIAAQLSKIGKTALRSKQETITPETAFYIADTLGELGLFYRLCDIVFMGGSLVAHGGQNPLEPARFSCALLTGPHTYNFKDVYQEMLAAGAVKKVENSEQLTQEIDRLLSNYSVLDAAQTKAKQLVDHKGGASHVIIDMFAPVFGQ